MIAELATPRSRLDPALWDRETLQCAQAGAVLFEEGEKPRGIHILHSGTIDLVFHSRNGELKPLRTAACGEILGLGAMVSGRNHECTARLRTPCEIGFIDRETFFRLLGESPSMWFHVLRMLSQDLNASYQSLRSASSAR